MNKTVLLGLGVVIAVLGAIFALQGFGVIGGSPMSGTTVWSVLGPIIFLVGAAMVLVAVRRRPRR